MFRYVSKDVPAEYDTMIYRARVLASPTRLEVWECIGEVGMYAGDIARTLDIAPSTVSYHLAVFAEAGLVVAAKQGRNVLYRWTGERWGVVSAAELEAGVVA
jgi:DNA-binding transcriptional ArsR family regulator